MSNNRIKDIVLKQHARDARRTTRKRRQNSKPEQLVVNAILDWAKSKHMDLQVVESKAIYSVSAGRYLHSMTSESMPDLIGNFNELSVWIEVKAAGRIKTLKEHQRAFLARKASAGCFACVADSVEMVNYHFSTFNKLSREEGITYLMNYLEPKNPHVDELDLF